MLYRAVIAFLLALTFALPGFSEPPVPTETTAAVLIKRVPPLYPAKAIERGQEGWVDVSFSVTPEGTTSAIRIISEYPRHVFSRSAINAVAKWTYRPRLEGGVAVPQGYNRAVLSFALSDSTAIRDSHTAQFTAGREAIAAHDWVAAAKVADEISGMESLNLFELASLEELKGRIAFGQQRFAAAADSLTRAIEITAHFGPETRESILATLVRARLNSGDLAAAVAIFDQWDPPMKEETRDLRRAVESARTQLGVGHADNP